MTEPKRTRDELADLIADGNLDKGQKIIAAALLRMAAAMNDIKDQLGEMQTQLSYRLAYTAGALAEIHVIYGLLQETRLDHGSGKFARERAVLRERLDNALETLEKAAGGKGE
jgi:hypothetical protein